MIGFNFLPWREAERREKKARFARLSLLHALLGAAIVLMVWVVNQSRLGAQADRHALLKSRISLLDQQIREIASLRRDIEALQARQRSVETLQADRHQPVHLLQRLNAQVPDGVMLKSLKQDDRIQLSGYALSNARVSELLRKLDAQQTGADAAAPELVEIKSASYGEGKEARRLFEFTLALPASTPGAGR